MKTTTKLCLIWMIWLLTAPFLLLLIAGSLSRDNILIPIISAAVLLATTTCVILLHKKFFRELKNRQ